MDELDQTIHQLRSELELWAEEYNARIRYGSNSAMTKRNLDWLARRVNKLTALREKLDTQAWETAQRVRDEVERYKRSW